jgi:hypothetical protein
LAQFTRLPPMPLREGRLLELHAFKYTWVRRNLKG